MNRFRVVSALGLFGSIGIVSVWSGCSSSSDGAPGDSVPDAAIDASAGDGGVSETCTATFRWLQKDAYKSTPGRNSKLWPPHTTTTFDVTCQSGSGIAVDAGSTFHENHGTTPQTTDDAGTLMLQEMKRETVTGSRAALLALMATYESCQCDPTTKFLTLDEIEGDAGAQLISNLTDYLNANLSCPDLSDGGPGTASLVASLQGGDIPTVLAELPGCTWMNDAGLADGLNQAWGAIVAASAEVIDGYHVCNNDAELQAGLWEGFRSTQTATSCDSDASTCHGPSWFYDP